MKKIILSAAMALASIVTVAQTNDFSTEMDARQNQVVMTTNDGTKYYNVSDIKDITIDGAKVAIARNEGSFTLDGQVKSIAFQKAMAANVVNESGCVYISEASGWLESAYVKFLSYEGAASYNIYIKGGKLKEYTKLDTPLVRNYGAYGRADAVGLMAADDYSMKIVPVDKDGNEMLNAANEAKGMSVKAYDRQGFAHKDGFAPGAYNNDGTLKAGARVIYITKKTAKTVKLDVITGKNNKEETITGLQAILDAHQKGLETRPLAIRIVGTISKDDCDKFSSSAEGIQIKGKSANSLMNITVEGIGDDATTTGFGFLIRNCKSIEMRNFANMLCMDDCVSLDTDNSNIWVHHLDLFYGNTGGDADQAKGDGTVDIKGDSKYVTVAYNHFWDSGKSSLCGMTSESGPNWITYHHNWFDHSDSRHPRIRTMSVHVWNNYYDGNSKYGVGAAKSSNAFVEANYFRNCKCPMLISRQGSDISADPDGKGTFSGEDGGMIKSWANKIVGSSRYVTYQQNKTEFDAYEASSRDEIVPETVTAKAGGRKYDNWDTDESLMYAYTPDAAADVPSIVTGWLGAGRMGHGDLQWTFDNATEDANFAVIPGLKSALQNYKTKLLGFFGDENEESGEQGGEDPTPSDPTDPTDPTVVEPIEGVVLCTFDKNGKPSNSLFTVVGSGSSSKGTATVDGEKYTTCLKMESSTSIKFTLPSAMKMTLYFGDTETASIKIDGEGKTATTSWLSTSISEGSHELTKKDSRNLFAIKLEPEGN